MGTLPGKYLLAAMSYSQFEVAQMKASLANRDRGKGILTKKVSKWEAPKRDTDSKRIDESVREIPGGKGGGQR